MKEFLLIFHFILGLFIGSFLNCIIYRLKRGESFLKGRSFCPYCKHTLSWKDLIPLFSFIILKGHCRYCKKKISLQYPLVELFTAFLFTSSLFLPFPSILVTGAMAIVTRIFLLIIFSFLILIFVFDLKYYSIPDKIIYPAILISFLYLLYFSFFVLHSFSYFLYSLFSTFCFAFFFFSLWFFSKGKAMGFGDWEVVVFLGFFLGFPKILICVFFAFFLGAIVGAILVLLKKKTLKSEIPFAPFLVISALISLFFLEFIGTGFL